MPDHDSRRTRLVRRSVVALGVSTCLVGAGLLSVVGDDARDGARAHRRDADAVEMMQWRAALRRVVLDDVNVQLLNVFDEATTAEVDAAARRRVSLAGVAREPLERLATSGSRDVRGEADAMLDVLAGEVFQTPADVDPNALYDATWAVLDGGRPPVGQLRNDLVGLHELMTLDSVGRLVLNDALDAAYTVDPRPVPAHIEDYVGQSAGYIRSDDAGYLGPDGEHPLIESWLYDALADPPHPALAEIETIVAGSDLWVYDQWVQSWTDDGPDPGPAPLALGALVTEADRVDTELRALVDSTLTATRESYLDDASAGERTARLAFGGAIGLVIVALGVVGAIARRQWRAMRLAADQRGRDPLTGVYNRYQLDHLAELVERTPETHHLVAAVDMDRFKLINDTLGHRAGDRVLVEVAERLQTVVARRRTNDGSVTGSVIRMGGDEFVITLHSRDAIDVTGVRAELDAIRASTVEVEGEHVELTFSIGIAAGRGDAGLHELLDVADLAAYEDKARRRTEPPAPYARSRSSVERRSVARDVATSSSRD